MTERDVKYKILVVDDEADVRSLLKDYFELNNYLVLTAQNGEEALEKAAQNPHIILLDINMPDRDNKFWPSLGGWGVQEDPQLRFLSDSVSDGED